MTSVGLPASSLQGQRVLVTGAGGFIGTRLCRRLIDEGASVHAAARREPSHLSGIARGWAIDVARPDALKELMDSVRPEVVFHLASVVTGDRALDRVWPTFHNNLAGTVNLLAEATRAGCERIVLTGSMEVPRDEMSEAVPVSPYAAAKWASGIYARMFHALYTCPVVVLRVFMTYGPGQRDHAKLVPYVIRSLLEGTTPRLSSGTRMVDWVYVDDVVEAYLCAARAPTAVGRSVDVGTGSLVSIREVVRHLARMVGTDVQPEFGARPDRPLESSPVADVEATYRILGWRAITDLEEGLRRTVEWESAGRTANRLPRDPTGEA